METSLMNYILFWVCIFGLCLGSFFNVVILRSLSGESIVFPASKCPKCNNKLKPWHNIPIFSFIFLRGKCAFCKEKISFQYPLIEFITMLLFAFSFIKFGLDWRTLFAIFISSSMLIMTCTDIKEKLVDCNIAIALAIVGLLYNWLINDQLLSSVLGLLAGILVFELLACTGHLFKKGRAFGEADTYVAAALGACFGLHGLFVILFYTLIAAMLFIIPNFFFKQLKQGHKVTCILLILFALSALIYETVAQNWYSFTSLVIIGILLIINILKSLRNESSLTYFPLVPAFAIATLYFLFF